MPKKLTNLIFGHKFNQKIEANCLPKNLLFLNFGDKFNQKIEPNVLPNNLTNLTFGYKFNQKIDPNTLPENLLVLTFGLKFNQKLDSEMLPSNLKNINFEWINYADNNDSIKHHIKMVNNIPSYYHVKIILLEKYISDIDKPKWPIHVINCGKNKFSLNIYEIHDKYIHPNYGYITVLINEKTYQPYSSAKSALK